ncbi:COMM domain containing 1 [Pelomyxa schiedti]|nr:COMM domain containing 1 [Pelomyxa schiedti]
MAAADNIRSFHSLLVGVVKREYERDDTITVQILKEKLFPALEVPAVEQLYNLCKDILARAAYEDYEASQLETFMKLKKVPFSQPQKDIMLKFWKNQRAKIHDVMRKRTTWNPTLEKVSWRIDVKAKSRSSGAADINEQTAIFELMLAKQTQTVLRFEMDKPHLTTIVSQLDEIEAAIKSAAEGPSATAPTSTTTTASSGH